MTEQPARPTPEEVAQLKAAAKCADGHWPEQTGATWDFEVLATPATILALLAQAQRDAEAVGRLTAALAAAEAARDLYVTKITELSGRLANMERGA